MREVVLDTETTGLDPSPNGGGHRIIELAAVELNGVKLGRRWHSFFNPERPIDQAATDVHGINDAQLKHEPKFADMVGDFLDFIGDALLIAHNAPFDESFLKAEMWRCGHGDWKATWFDTLPIARKKIPRSKHTLDALCRHYGIRKTKRGAHSALIDVILLAQVYAHLVGRLDQLELNGVTGGDVVYMRGGEYIILAECGIPHPGPRPEPLPSRLTLAELRAHKAFMKQLEEDRLNAASED